VLLVVRADRTDRRGASESLERLDQVGAEVLGVVFNDADGSTYGYYDRYYYDSHGEEPEERRAGLKRLLPFG
jgi:Mrp family chromosome partitioning ATPase